ncbi:enoyl-CoA hydratase/isomerase family protein [Microbacterium sp. No. 7]|uniref:enoyl-CoA hydratase/isomerase family protein n=1 Tax=Microbacterium sp. No. 7 TaxID=1714373 RepID=UPI0006CF9E21|nr:enoyl-CoA hydratase/isomerase family protein [Microbacterium sp. No. 7]ALJ21890.1 hypothetical protein AOA12_19100 [Microbacterium sp. No. 7]
MTHLDLETAALRVDGPLAVLTLRRPPANSLGLQLAADLHAALAAAEAADDVAALVLTGEGRFFCAGGDVAEMAAHDDTTAYVTELVTAANRAVLGMRRTRLLTVAAIGGVTAGAGLGLGLHADVRIASASATFVGAYGTVGLTPDCGVSFLLPAAIGRARAAALLLTGTRLSAHDALAWGLVDAVVDADPVGAAVERALAALARTAPSAIAPTRDLLFPPLDEHERLLAREAHAIARASEHPDARARIHRFAGER